MKKGRKQSEHTQALRVDATGMIRDVSGPNMSKKSKRKTCLKLKSSTEESSFVAESGEDPPKKPMKKKNKKVSSNRKKASLAQRVHFPEQEDENSTSTTEMKKELLWAEREAKMLRSEQRVILAGSRLEKKGMSEALKKLEREREEMVEIIAQLEDEKYGAGNEPCGHRAEPLFAGDEHDTMASLIRCIDVVESESGDEYSAAHSCHDDEDSSAGWLGSEIARRSGHTHELRQHDPDPTRKLSRARSSRRNQSTGMDPLSLSTRYEQVSRSRSSDRMKLTGMGPLSLSARSDHEYHSESSSGENHKYKTRSTKDRPLNIDDYYAKMQRSRSSERTLGSERNEGRSVRRAKSAEKMLLPAQSMHGDTTKSMRSRTKAEILMSRSDYGDVGRRQKLPRVSSERHLQRMEPPQRGLIRINSDKRPGRKSPSQRMVRGTHSGDNLVEVERYY
jgi:hypothetical protein